MEMPSTIADAARQISAKQISPVELTRTCLDRIARIDMHVHSFLLVTEERALADARAAEARIMRDGSKGPLDGIPSNHHVQQYPNITATFDAVIARKNPVGFVAMRRSV